MSNKPLFNFNPVGWERTVKLDPGYNNLINIPEDPVPEGRYCVINYMFAYEDQSNPSGNISVVESYANASGTQFKVRFYNAETNPISINVAPITASQGYPRNGIGSDFPPERL
ncbi:hypothetical protein [Bacillus thuringiensis]|uniref:hypothetical protein n=1 Tax=Bacillus thuringiensis TaxID=1428 RepID=UPI000BF62FA3|nr:hypothetical protein [Bacillus thuringiensis]PFC27730.1 hypothetical protein CN299_21830 [Bacillus thuringiensis]